MTLSVNESNITWPGRLQTKPEGFMIPTHLKVLTIEEKPFVYVREITSGEPCLPEEIPCPHFNVTEHESKNLLNITRYSISYTLCTIDLQTFTATKTYCCKGYCMDLLKELSKTINFTYSLALSPDGQFGSYVIKYNSGATSRSMVEQL